MAREMAWDESGGCTRLLGNIEDDHDYDQRFLRSILPSQFAQDEALELTKNSSTLKAINDQFLKLAPWLEIVSLYETVETELGQFNKIILDKDSSVLGYHNETVIPLHTDHQSISKFSSRQDPSYIKVRDMLNDLVTRSIKNATIQTRRDAYISALGPTTLLTDSGYDFEPEVKDHLENDDTTSMKTTDTKSIFSYADSLSSMSSAQGSDGVSDEFVLLLLEQDCLKPLYVKIRKTITPAKFKIQFLKLLQLYSRNLLDESNTTVEKGVAEFVRRSRRRITSKLVPIIYNDLSGKPLFLPKEADPGDRDKRLEEWLKRMGPVEIHAAPNGDTVPTSMDGDESEGETSSSDDDVVEEKPNPNLQRLKIFLLESKAFEQLQIGVEVMVAPKEARSKMWVNKASGELRPIEDRPKFAKQKFSKFNVIINNIRRAWGSCFRPQVPPGDRRVEWKCECGTWLYGDFDNSKPNELDSFVKSLQDHDTDEARGTTSHSATHSDIVGGVDSSGPSLHAHSPSAYVGGAERSGRPQAHPSLVSTNTAPNPGTDITNHISQQTRDSIRNLQRKFFALCLKTKKNYTVLGEVEVTTITRDCKLFEEINNKYSILRRLKFKSLKSLIFKALDIKFVQFTIEDFHRVDIHSQRPIIPPEIEVLSRNYEYTPYPLTIPPISPDAFLHYLSHHTTEGSLRERKWFDRMPKKLGQSLLDIRRTSEIEKDVIGWSIHIIEGPNRARITLLTIVVVGVSLVVPLVYTLVTKDISGGYAIGAWIVASWTAILTALFYQWTEE